MALIKHTKVPQNTYGPYEHTLFLGCSVRSFSLSGGWNEQQSSLTVNLVQETRANPATCDAKVYYDKHLTRKTTHAADPGFTYPTVGSPVYFRVADFEFSGLIQSYTEQNDTNGKPVYSVVIVDPREILANCQVIIGDYAGSVSTAYNLFNVFGYMEAFGLACPETTINGATFGTPAGAFGGSLSNDRGMQWNRIKSGVEILTSAFPKQANQFSPYGRILFRGAAPSEQGYGVIKHSRFDVSIPVNFANHNGYLNDYFLDFFDVPNLPNYFRFSGTNMSIMDLISQACEAAGCDFYIELLPVVNGSIINNIIKVRTVDRLAQPSLGAISNFIANNSCYVSKSSGQELRNETTSAILIGGHKQTVFQMEQVDSSNPAEILPYWGVDSNGDLIKGTQATITRIDKAGNPMAFAKAWRIPVDLTDLNASLYTPLASNSVVIWEEELIAAEAGFKMWLGTAMAGTPLGTLMKAVYATRSPFGGADELAAIIADLDAGKFRPADFLMGGGGGVDPELTEQRDLEKIFAFVQAMAQDYGRKFIVQMPYTCVKLDTESTNLSYSEEPSSDGGWTDESSVIEANNPSDLLDFFSDDVGKVEPFVRFDGAASLDSGEGTTQGKEDSGIADGDLFIRASLEGEFVFDDYSTQTGPWAVISIPNIVRPREITTGFAKELGMFINIIQMLAADDAEKEAIALALDGAKGKVDLWSLGGFYDQPIKIPDAAAVPLKSNISRYGPWVVRGPAGGVKVEVDDGLVPWEFGSTVQMGIAASALVQESLTYMQAGEVGNIVSPGYPIVPLGAELGATNGGAFGGGRHLLENREVLTNEFSDTKAGDSDPTDITSYRTNIATKWSGIYGPNITGIDVSVDPDQGVQTSYSMRTYTPKLNRFSKQNADRMKKIGQSLTRVGQQINAAGTRKLRIGSASARAENARIRKIADAAAKKAAAEKAAKAPGETPSTIILGQVDDWDKTIGDGAGGYRRANVGISQYKDVPHQILENYSETAFCSLDGLFRPISMDGDGNFPRYYQSIVDYAGKPFTEQSEPPVDGASGVEVNILYLNPYTNPDNITDNNRHLKHANTSDTTNRNAHDIDFVARSGSIPGHLSIPLSDDAIRDGSYSLSNYVGYTPDYRTWALRGPLLVQGWGYDLQGKPIPNAADSEGTIGVNGAANGEYVSTGLKDTFLADFLKKPQTWPVAPVDLRFDRERGVWTSPSSFRQVPVELTELLDGFGPATANILDGITLYESDGSAVSTKEIEVWSHWDEVYIPSGKKGIAYFDSWAKKYYIAYTNSIDVQTIGGGGSGLVIQSGILGDYSVSGDMKEPGYVGNHPGPFAFHTTIGIAGGDDTETTFRSYDTVRLDGDSHRHLIARVNYTGKQYSKAIGDNGSQVTATNSENILSFIGVSGVETVVTQNGATTTVEIGMNPASGVAGTGNCCDDFTFVGVSGIGVIQDGYDITIYADSGIFDIGVNEDDPPVPVDDPVYFNGGTGVLTSITYPSGGGIAVNFNVPNTPMFGVVTQDTPPLGTTNFQPYTLSPSGWVPDGNALTNFETMVPLVSGDFVKTSVDVFGTHLIDNVNCCGSMPLGSWFPLNFPSGDSYDSMFNRPLTDVSGVEREAATSIVNSSYQWTLYTGSTYYLEASGGGDPGISEGGHINENGSLMDWRTTPASPEDFNAGEFSYGDFGGGYNTFGVRLTDSVDPDTKADDYLSAIGLAYHGSYYPWSFNGSNALRTSANIIPNLYGSFTVLMICQDINSSLDVILAELADTSENSDGDHAWWQLILSSSAVRFAVHTDSAGMSYADSDSISLADGATMFVGGVYDAGAQVVRSYSATRLADTNTPNQGSTSAIMTTTLTGPKLMSVGAPAIPNSYNGLVGNIDKFIIIPRVVTFAEFMQRFYNNGQGSNYFGGSNVAADLSPPAP